MQPKHVAFVLLFAISGCVGPTKTRGRVIGTALAGAGALMIGDSLAGRCDSDSIAEAAACGAWKKTGWVPGSIFLAAGAVVLAYNEQRTLPSVAPLPEPPPPPAVRIEGAELVPKPATVDPMLKQLTLQASFAARDRRCVAVKAIAKRVDSIDRPYRNGAFLADEAIAACL